MTTPASSSPQAIEFVRQYLLARLSRPTPAIAIYPQNTENSFIRIAATPTQIGLYYVYNNTNIEIFLVDYVGLTVEEVVRRIAASTIPVRAVALCRDTTLRYRDLALSQVYSFEVPSEFTVYDRLPDNGIVLRIPRICVRHKSLVQLQIKKPYGDSVFAPWYPRVSVGSFTYKLNGETYHFSVPEFDDQVWSLKYGKPFRDVTNGSLTLVGPNAYKVSRSPLYWSGDSLKLYNGNTPIASNVIVDVDTNNGIIYTTPEAPISEQTSIDYSYIEQSYEYRYVNINGHASQNPYLLDKFVLIYALPSDGTNVLTRKRTLYHQISDSIEGAIASIVTPTPDTPIAIIGGYHIQQVRATSNVNILDTRSLGGGLVSEAGPRSPVTPDDILETKTNQKKIEDSYRESPNFWDIGNWDGEIYPGAAAVVMDLPDELKEVLPASDLKQRAAKFLAAGVYPIYNFSDRELPSVEGMSAQVASLMNGSFSEQDATGPCWLTDTLDITASALTGDWSSADVVVPTSLKEGAGVLTVGPLSGFYQSYLKSTPIAGIQWYQRSVELISGSTEGSVVTSSWERHRVYDTREVATGQLIKGYVKFEKAPTQTDYRDVVVHSPFRLDTSGAFQSDVSRELQNIEATLLTRGTEEALGFYVSSDISNIDTTELTATPDYVVGHRGLKFLFEHTGLFDPSLVVKTALKVEDNFYSSPPYLNYYAGGSDQFLPLGTGSLFDPRDGLTLAAAVLGYLGPGGYDPSKLTACLLVLSGIATNLTNGYLPSQVYYSGETFYPQEQIVPELLGYSHAEVSATSNTDFLYLRNLPTISSFARIVEGTGTSHASTLSYSASIALSTFQLAVARSERALNENRTYNGTAAVNHWYIPYNRYGKYLGQMTKDVTQVIDDLVYYNTSYGGSYTGQPGLDGRAVETYYTGLSYLLDMAYTGTFKLLTKGGMLEPEIADLVYSYGWITKYQNITGILNMSLDVDPVPAKYSGLFTTGMVTLLKGMVTPEGEFLQTTLVNQEPGPFPVTPPSKIFDTLALAIYLDPGYKPLVQAAFNTLTGKYSVNGAYWEDALRVAKDAGAEDDVSLALAHLYGSLQ